MCISLLPFLPALIMTPRSILSSLHRPFHEQKTRTQVLASLLVLTMGGSCLLSATMLMAMRHSTWQHATQTSRNLVKAEVNEIERTLTIYDASIRSAAVTLNDPALREASPWLKHLALFDRIRDTPDLGPIRILDANGEVMYDSSTLEPPAASHAERQAVDQQRVSTGNGPILSAPFPAGRGAYAITISHRVTTLDGLHAVVVGTVNLHLFLEQLQELKLSPRDGVSLFTDTGVLLIRIPGDRLAGFSIVGSKILTRFESEASGVFVDRSMLDGTRRAFSFKHVARWPLFLDVGLSMDDLFRPWHRRMMTTGVLIGVMMVFTLLLLALLRRDLRSKLKA